MILGSTLSTGSVPIVLVDQPRLSGAVRQSVLKQLTSGFYLMCWCTAGSKNGAVHVRIIDKLFAPVCDDATIEMVSGLFAADVAALLDGGFALAWNDQDRIMLRFFDSDGTAGETLPLAKSNVQVPELRVEQFPTGEIAVSWQEGLVIAKRGSAPLLTTVSATAWHSAIAILNNGNLLRVDTGREKLFSHAPPIYYINGAIFGAAANRVGEFRYEVATKIVGDTYAHPQQLRALRLGDGFLLVWTDISHHLGNSIQALRFDSRGNLASELVTIVEASPDTYVDGPSMIRTPSGGLWVAWSHSASAGYSLKTRHFSDELLPLGTTFVVASRSIRPGGSVISNCSGEIFALWHEDRRICLRSIFEPVEPSA